MTEFTLNQDSLAIFAQLILGVVITLYLLSLKSKSTPTRLLIAFFALYTLLLFVFIMTLAPPVFVLGIYFEGLTFFIALLTLIPMLQFAYRFPSLSPELRREAKIVLWISVLTAFLGLGLTLNFFYRGQAMNFIILNLLLVVGFLWIFVVLLRQTIRLSVAKATPTWFNKLLWPEGKAAKGARAFALTLVLPMLAVVAGLLHEADLISGAVQNSTTTLILLLFLFILVIVYLNHAPEPATLLVKLIGVSLVTALALLSIVGFVFAPILEATYQNESLITTPQTVHFEPNQAGGYDIRSIPFSFDDEFGQNLGLGNDNSATIPLDFTFHFYDRGWTKFYISDDGLITFDSPYNTRAIYLSLQTAIAPLWSHFNPAAGGSIFHKNDIGKETITWYQVPDEDTGQPNTMQLILNQDGTFTISYNDLNPALNSMIAILPGNRSGAPQNIHFNEDLPYSGLAQQGIIDDFFIPFEQYLHERMILLAYLMLGVTGFILLGYPLFFRANLFKPLDALVGGVTEVNAGNLDIAVPVQFNDEIGFLTNSFNGMVASVKKADQLKDEFLANTSHELRTPLNGIIGLAESMVDGAVGPLSKEQSFNLEMIVYSGRRLTNLVNDILDFSRLQHQDLELQCKPIDLRALTDIVLTLSQPLLGPKKLQLVNDIPSDLPLANADEDRLQQIMHNLVGNAIKFTEAGEVRVSAKVVQGSKGARGQGSREMEDQGNGPQSPPSANNQSLITITVSDTGIGIPADKFADIFASFQQVNASITREYGGTGLGLSVTKQLVDLHGGAIWVESTLGEGSHFHFTLPVSTESVEHPATISQTVARVRNDAGVTLTTASSTETNGKRHTILVVDDEPINIQVLTNYLTPNNFTVTRAFDGYEALTALERKSPDVVLLDIMMPRMSGYEVCQKIRQHHPPHELPIIMLTAKNQVADLVGGFQAGANDYLTKPFAKDELLSRVNTHLRLAKTNLAYGRFVPREFLYFLEKEDIIDLNLGDQVQHEMTILFSDVRSFTSLSEGMTPKENFDFINTLLSEVGPIIRKHSGFIDKYIGDAIMALFPEQADAAVQAGIAMLKRITQLNAKRQAQGQAPVQIGVGLHTGNLMLGTIGEHRRMDTTVISDAVNLASRMEGLTKRYGAGLLISEQTFNQLADPNQYHIRFVDKVRVKGKRTAVGVYEVFDGDDGETIHFKDETKSAFEEGVSHYYKQEFQVAQSQMAQVLARNSQDKVALLYMQRATQYAEQGVPTDWDGVTKMVEK